MDVMDEVDRVDGGVGSAGVGAMFPEAVGGGGVGARGVGGWADGGASWACSGEASA